MRRFNSGDELIAFWKSRSDDPEYDDVRDRVRAIIRDVRQRKDDALREYTQRFDGVPIDSFRVPENTMQEAKDSIVPELLSIFTAAAKNIRAYHERQSPESWQETSTGGITLGQRFTPVDSAGIYVPGGRAVYPSTILMNVIPAQVAGVKRIAVVSPPDKTGSVSPMVLACAALLGVTEVYAAGGAQAVAALAYGTESIPAVAKITGPGNKYVNEAKMQVFGTVGIDMPAGPTELAVYADESASPEFIVADLFAQAEHDVDAKTALIASSVKILDDIESLIELRVKSEPRSELVRSALGNNGAAMAVDSTDNAVEIINAIAPEHLELLCEDAESVADSVVNAGSIFIGNYTPNAVGDYWAGPNHTLPTGGAAQFASPLNVLDFMKFSAVTGYTRDAIGKVSADVAAFARAEGLEAHAHSMEVRSE